MQQNDQWAQFRKRSVPVPAAPQLPTEPQPFPGAKPIVLERPASKQAQDTYAANRDARDANADVRANKSLENENLRLQNQLKETEIKLKSVEANGGLETSAQNETAAGHYQTLQTNLDLINQAVAKNPKAFAPGLLEAAVGDKLGEQFRGLAASPERNVVRQSYGPILESAIYLATGAAAQQDQVTRLAGGLVPVYTDGPEELKAKAIRLEAELAKAASIAGPAGEKARAAIAEVRKLYPLMYGIDAQDVMNPLMRPGNNVPQTELSGESKQVPIPPEMQAEFNSWLRQNPPGSLTVEKFMDFYGPLFKKYDFGGAPNMNQQAAEFVKAYNTGAANTTIPNPSKKLEGLNATAASAAADKGAVGDAYVGTMNAANAFSFGAPEFLAGREGRAAFDKANEAHPLSALAGEVAGSVAPVTAATKYGMRFGEKVFESPVTNQVMSELLANAGYGATRGAAGAEPEDRLSAAGYGAALGGGSALAGRALIEGAPGFLGVEKRRALETLGGQDFAIPPSRQPLPADDITPARFQSLDDAGIRQELDKTQRGIDAWGANKQATEANNLAMLRLRADAQKVAQENVEKQKLFRRELSRSSKSGSAEDIRNRAAEEYPTTLEGVLGKPEFVARAKALETPGMDGVEPLDVLAARRDRLTDYLGQDPTPKTGKIEAVDLTTPQRMGMGETEESLQGLPFVHGQRESAQASFNRHNSARVLARVGKELPKDIKAGTELNEYVNKQLAATYNELRPSIRGRIDQGFENGIAALRKQGTKTPERAALWSELEDVIKEFRKPDGTFDGEGYKKLSTTLRRYSETWNNANAADSTVAKQDLARLAESARKQAQALVGRANPSVGRRLKAVEGAWAHQMRIENASVRAIGNRGIYTPDELLGSIRQLDTSRNKGAVARGKALDQGYAQDAKTVLGGKPVKKTSTQSVAIMGYALSQVPALGALLTVGSAGYVPGVKKVIQAMVEGKLGKTPAAVEQALGQSSAGRAILKATNNDSRRILITQMLQAYGSK